MSEKQIVTPSIPAEQYSETDLSIQIAPDGLVFYAVNSLTHQCHALSVYQLDPEMNEESWLDALEKGLKEIYWLQGNWKSVRILWVTEKWISIPSAYFRPEEAKNFLMYHELFREYDEVHYYTIRKPSTTFVFPVPGTASHIIGKFFTSFRYYPSWAPVSLQFDSAKPQGLCVILHHAFADYFVHTLQGTDNFSRFSWQEPSDILFSLAKISRDFALDLVSDSLIVCGYPGLKKANETEALIREYFPSLNVTLPLIKVKPNITNLLSGLEIPVQLLNLPLCE